MKALLITNKIKQYALGFQVVIEALECYGYEGTWAANLLMLKDILAKFLVYYISS